MRRLSSLVVALVVVAVVTTLTAAGLVAWAIRDNGSPRMGPGMMAGDSGPRSSTMMGMGGWADVAGEPEYLTEMIAHHREAVAAASELARSDRAEMRSFGLSIIETQSAQIEQMEGWMGEWYPQQPTTDDYRPMMRDLSGLSGDRLDRAFLQDMVGHHMAAVMMSQHLLWRGTDHAEVADLARSIRDEQRAEIVQMQRWLGQWFDTGWSGGMGGRMCPGGGSMMGPGMMSGSGR